MHITSFTLFVYLAVVSSILPAIARPAGNDGAMGRGSPVGDIGSSSELDLPNQEAAPVPAGIAQHGGGGAPPEQSWSSGLSEQSNPPTEFWLPRWVRVKTPRRPPLALSSPSLRASVQGKSQGSPRMRAKIIAPLDPPSSDEETSSETARLETEVPESTPSPLVLSGDEMAPPGQAAVYLPRPPSSVRKVTSKEPPVKELPSKGNLDVQSTKDSLKPLGKSSTTNDLPKQSTAGSTEPLDPVRKRPNKRLDAQLEARIRQIHKKFWKSNMKFALPDMETPYGESSVPKQAAAGIPAPVEEPSSWGAFSTFEYLDNPYDYLSKASTPVQAKALKYLNQFYASCFREGKTGKLSLQGAQAVNEFFQVVEAAVAKQRYGL